MSRSELQVAYADFSKAYREKLTLQDPEMKGKMKTRLISKAWKQSEANPNRVMDDKSSKKVQASKKKKTTKNDSEEEDEE